MKTSVDIAINRHEDRMKNIPSIRTNLPKKEFKWIGGTLHQKVEVIQDRRIFTTWSQVTVEGEQVIQSQSHG